MRPHIRMNDCFRCNSAGCHSCVDGAVEQVISRQIDMICDLALGKRDAVFQIVHCRQGIVDVVGFDKLEIICLHSGYQFQFCLHRLDQFFLTEYSLQNCHRK